jgi:hypothetical protein
MSDEVLQKSTLLVDTDEEKMYFIGNLSLTGVSWFGDDIRATGQVDFRYLEIEVASTRAMYHTRTPSK